MVSGLFHSPRRGAFHRSLTVLVHYRSLAVFSLGLWSARLPARFRVSGGTHVLRHVRRSGSTLRGSHPLRRPVPAAFRCPELARERSAARSPQPSNPRTASPAGCTAARVWAPPRSLAATRGILSFPRGTEMFQFPRFPPESENSGPASCTRGVAPFGDPRITGCQLLPGAFRRVATSFIGRQRQGIHHALIIATFSSRPELHTFAWTRSRPSPSSHRLPDLSCLAGGTSLFRTRGGVRGQDRGNRSFSFFSQSLHTRHRARPARWVHRHSCTQPVFVVQDPAQPPVSQRKACRTPDDPGHGRSHQVVPAWHVVNVHSGGAGSRPVARPRPPSTGGAAGTRTPDPRRAKAVLSQLSYDPRSALPLPRPAATGLACALPNSTPAPPPAVGGRAWTRTRGLGLIRAAL